MKYFKINITQSLFFFLTVMMTSHNAVLFGATQTSEAVVKKEEAKLIGSVDIRPSWTPQADTFNTENTVEVGVKFSSGIPVSYAQFFSTNLFDSAGPEGGMGFKVNDGFLRARFNNLWKSSDEKLSFSYQPRVYLPVDSDSRDKGMVVALRNYLILNRNITDDLSVSLMELPIVHLFSQPGFNGTPNPIFENRVLLIGNASLSKVISVSVPIMFHAKRNRDYQQGAALNNAWAYVLWVNPEVTFTTSANTAVALGYYSSNLVESDLSGFTIKEGLESGVVQLSFQASL